MPGSRRLAARALFAAGLLLVGTPRLPAQGTADDYARAATLGGEFRSAVQGASLTSFWVSDTELIFQRFTGQKSWEWLHLDAESGVESPAIDVAALRRLVHGSEVSPGRLEIDGFVGAPEGWLCAIGPRVFAVDRETRTVRAVEAPSDMPWRLQPVNDTRSRPARGETHIDIVNRLDRPITLTWMSSSAEEHDYGTIAPGDRRRQHTYVGHVWWIKVDGEPIGRFRAARDRWLIWIDESTEPWQPRSRPEDPRPRGRTRSPDERWRAYTHDGELRLQDIRLPSPREIGRGGSDEETPRHVRFPTVNLDATATQEDGYRGRVTWSPDSRRLFVLRSTEPEDRIVTMVESSPRDQLQPRAIEMTYRKPGDPIDIPRPVFVDVEKRTITAIETDLIEHPLSISHVHWSVNGSECRFLVTERGHQVQRILAASVSDFSVRVVHEETSPTFIDTSQKTFLEWWPDGSACVWASERSGWNHLYRIEARDGTITPITSGAWLVTAIDRIDFEAGTIDFRAQGVFPDQDPYHVHYGRVHLDGTGLTWWTEGDGTHEGTLSPDGRYFIDTFSRVDLPPVHELRRVADGARIAELARAETSRLAELGWRAPERFVAKGRDGTTDIWGILLHPSNFDPAKRYPIVEQIYAGPHGHHVPKGFSPWLGAQAIAELGFVVGQIDGMGTNGRGKAFHDLCWQDIGDAGFLDRIAWWRAAAETRPFIDLDRVGIYGGSAGGQNAMRALIAHHDFYDVAVADCGCHDNRIDKMWWNEAWMGWPIGPHYDESSNVVQAHRLEGDLLLIVGELDRNVDPASTMQVVDALVRADKNFDLVVIPGAGHGAAGTPYGARRQADFLVRKLWGVEPRREEARGNGASGSTRP